MPTPISTNLDGTQIEELRDLLCRTFIASELEQVVRITLGDGLYEEYSGEGLPLKETAFKLVVGLEHRGTTDLFLRGVLKARPRVPNLAEQIARLCPRALQPGLGTREQIACVVHGVRAVQSKLAEAAVLSRISPYTMDFNRTWAEVELLQRYKALHERLHMVQLKHYRQVIDAARRFRTDSLAFSTLEEYLSDLRLISAGARTDASKLPDVAGSRRQELAWIGTLEEVVNHLRQALDELDERPAAEAIRKLKRLLRVEPFRVNRLLAVTVQGLPLPRLIEALEKVVEAVPPEDPIAPVFQAALAALQVVLPMLMGRVAEHTLWQDVENDLWQAEESLYQGLSGVAESLEDFRILWQEVKARVGSICLVDPEAAWTVELFKYADDFEQAFPLPPGIPEPARAQATFSRYRHQVMHQFYLLDMALKEQCGEVTEIGQPLRDLIEEMSSNGTH